MKTVELDTVGVMPSAIDTKGQAVAGQGHST
jgi:hypothetical protein